MGALVEKCLVFPAPPLVDRAGLASSPNVFWDEQPTGLPSGGVRRPFLWLPAPEALVTILYFHANAEDLCTVESWLSELRDNLGANVLAVEYPGYGLLQDLYVEGCDTTSVEGINRAAVHALECAVYTLGIPSVQVVLHGRSFGCGPALWLARYAQERLQMPLGGVILQSPYLSMTQVAGDHAGSLGSMLVDPYYDNLWILRQLCSVEAKEDECSQTPLLVLHGELDDVIHPYHGRKLYREALEQGHKAVEASFSPYASHDDWNGMQDLAMPISKFMLRHVVAFQACTEPLLMKL